MAQDYTYLADIAAEVQVPDDGIISRTLYQDDTVKVVLFGFDTGQELSEHTASMPAVMHVLKGEGRLVIGTDTMEAGPGAWAYMAPNTNHSVLARTPLVMVLYLQKAGKPAA